MSNIVLNRQQSRRIDQIAIETYRFHSLVLMENAGRGAAEALMEYGIDGGVSIFCGSGNNGGDGLVVARHLAIHGVAVKVVLLAGPDHLSPDARANWEILSKTDVPISKLESYDSPSIEQAVSHGSIRTDWIVDAMLGTGAIPPLRSPYDTIVEHLNRIPAKRLAIDLPTGLDCDTGEAPGAVFHANLTTTFVARKPGFTLAAGPAVVGEVRVVGIGIPQNVVQLVIP